MEKDQKQTVLVFKTGHSELRFGPVNEHGKLTVTNSFGGLECKYYLSPADIAALAGFLAPLYAPELPRKGKTEFEKRMDQERAEQRATQAKPGKPCYYPCEPSDFVPGGRCDKKGCYPNPEKNGFTDLN